MINGDGEQTRREFIKKSSALSLATLGSLSVQQKTHAAGSDIIKVGMVGCGGRGSGAAAQAMSADPGVRITAMADLFADRLERSRENLKAENPAQMAVNGDHCFTGFDGYKKVIDSGVDVVLIVQPNCYTEVSDIVMGTKGRAYLQKGRIEGEDQWRYGGKKVNPYQIEQDELFASVRSGRPINNGRYMALSAMAGIMGQMATYTGKKIEWNQAFAAGHIFGPAECDFSTEPPVKPRPDGTYPVRIPGVSRLA